MVSFADVADLTTVVLVTLFPPPPMPGLGTTEARGLAGVAMLLVVLVVAALLSPLLHWSSVSVGVDACLVSREPKLGKGL